VSAWRLSNKLLILTVEMLSIIAAGIDMSLNLILYIDRNEKRDLIRESNG
jgi:hypothetical protein